MKIRFACFKGISLISKLVKFWTRGEYSHIAYKTNFNSCSLIETWNNKYWSYSSYANHLSKTPVEIWSKDVGLDKFIIVDEFFKRLVKDKIKYDWKGILGFIFKSKDNSEKLFCSEGCSLALIEAGIWPNTLKPYKIHPSLFVDFLKVSGFILEDSFEI